MYLSISLRLQAASVRVAAMFPVSAVNQAHRQRAQAAVIQAHHRLAQVAVFQVQR